MNKCCENCKFYKYSYNGFICEKNKFFFGNIKWQMLEKVYCDDYESKKEKSKSLYVKLESSDVGSKNHE